MPYVNIKITREGTSPGATETTRQQKAAIIQGVSELLLHVLGKPLDSTFVVIEEVELDNWGMGGYPVTHYRQQKNSSAVHATTYDPEYSLIEGDMP